MDRVKQYIINNKLINDDLSSYSIETINEISDCIVEYKKHKNIITVRNNGDVLHYIGNIYNVNKKYELAEHYYLLSVNKGNFKSYYELARLKLLKNDVNYNVWKKSIHDIASQYYKICIHKYEELNMQTLSYSDEFKCGPNYIQLNIFYERSIIELSDLYFRYNKFDLAEKYLTKIENYEYLQLLCEILYKQDKYDMIYEYIDKAINNGDINIVEQTASLFRFTIDEKIAINIYLKAIDYGSKDSIINLASLYKSLKDYKNAEKYYLLNYKTIQDINSLKELALFYIDSDNNEQALKYCLQSLEKEDNDLLSYLPNLYIKLNNYDMAVEYEFKIYNKDPTQSKLYNLLYILKKCNKIELYEEYMFKLEGKYKYLIILIFYYEQGKENLAFENLLKYTHEKKYICINDDELMIKTYYYVMEKFHNVMKSLNGDYEYMLKILDLLNNLKTDLKIIELDKMMKEDKYDKCSVCSSNLEIISNKCINCVIDILINM